MADDIIQAIGKYSGVSPLSWHRLRHTWAERMADKLYNEPNGLEQLAYLGGWTNLHSVDHYIQEAKRQHAMECLRTYQGTLYEED
jgi:integrase